MNATSTVALLAVMFIASGVTACRRPSSPNDLPSVSLEVPSSSSNASERASFYVPSRRDDHAAEKYRVAFAAGLAIVASYE
jgi:hypothetical protein